MCFSLPFDNRLGPQAVPFSQGVSISVRPRSLSLVRTRREGRGVGSAAVARSRLPAYVRSESRAAGRAEAAPPSAILLKSGRAPFRRGVSLSGCSGQKWAPPSFRQRPLWGCDSLRNGRRTAPAQPTCGNRRETPGIARLGWGARKDPGGSN